MRIISLLILSLLFLSAIIHPTAKAQDSPAVSTGNLADPARLQLVIPDEIWTQVRDNVGYSDRPLGYSYDEMAHFKTGTACILRPVEILLRDIESVPQFSGRVGDLMLADPSNFASATFEA